MADSLFSAEDRQLLWKLAEGIERYHLTIPAIMYLEMHKPLAFIMSSFLLTLRPIAFLFMDGDQYTRVIEILEKRLAVEELLRYLEFAAQGKSPGEQQLIDAEEPLEDLNEDPVLAGRALHQLELVNQKQLGRKNYGEIEH